MNKIQEQSKNNVLSKLKSSRLVLILALFVLYALFSILTPLLSNGSSFVKYERILSALNYCYFIGFLSLGVMFVISTGGIDFSIGPVMFASALIGGYCFNSYGLPMGVSILISIAVGMAFGIFNGYFVAYRGIPSFITSMGSMQIAKGLGSIFTKTQSVTWPKRGDEGSWYRYLVRYQNIPTGLFILIFVAILCAILFHKMKAGRYLLSIGANREATRLSGLNTKKWEMLAFTISGIMAGIAAIFYVGAYTTVQPGLGDTFNNEAIASCVMGGTSMLGGSVSVLGTVIGSIIISLLQEGILAMGFTISYQYVLTGIIVLVAISADMLSNKKRV